MRPTVDAKHRRTAEQIAAAPRLGNGNLSEGLRAAVRSTVA